MFKIELIKYRLILFLCWGYWYIFEYFSFYNVNVNNIESECLLYILLGWCC